jgi:hypothetical protein
MGRISLFEKMTLESDVGPGSVDKTGEMKVMPNASYYCQNYTANGILIMGYCGVLWGIILGDFRQFSAKKLPFM